MRPKPTQYECDKFNEINPIGTKVRVWKGLMGDGPGIETEIQEPGAFILGGHSIVVKVPGDSIALTHVEIV